MATSPATTMRVLPPPAPAPNYITVNGRTYTCALGSTLDVPGQDGLPMTANGWSCATPGGGVGATAARPLAPYAGMTFTDTTVGAIILFDGTTWRNPLTGASV